MPGLLSNLPPPPENRTGWPWTEETPADSLAAPPASGWPEISIVCPSYRQGQYIEETIRSVLLQNYPGLELIVVDGGSTDGTVRILEKYAPWLAFWESTPDRGQSHALNKGFGRAAGELTGWINSDDFYLPGALAAVGRAFRTRSRSLIFGDWCECDGSSHILAARREFPACAFQVAVGARHLPSHATFWPRKFHQQLDESLQFTMDAKLFKSLAASGLKPAYLPRTLGVFRRHSAAKTTVIADVARSESEAWSKAQPWHTHYRWLAGRALARLQRWTTDRRS